MKAGGIVLVSLGAPSVFGGLITFFATRNDSDIPEGNRGIIGGMMVGVITSGSRPSSPVR
jgi:hypothetical protein